MATNDYDNYSISGRRSGMNRRILSDSKYKGPERRISERRGYFDKRKHIRYKVKDHTYVNLRSETEEVIGQLLDISKGGLAAHYPVNTEKSKNYSELGILSSIELATERFSFKAVSDNEVPSELKFSGQKLRRYSLEFKKLTPEQEAKLDFFISNYTLGEA